MARVAVIGCGATGSLCAGLMADAGHDVFCVARRREHAEAMNDYGIRVEGASGDRVAPVTGAVTAEGIGPCDLVIIATKAFDVQEAARKALPAIGPGTVVQSLQNGLGSPERIASTVDPDRLAVGVVIGIAARLSAPGHVQHGAMEDICFAPYAGLPAADLDAAVGIWRSAGFKAGVSPDLERMVWDKLVLNVGLSGVTALTGMTIGEVMENPSAWDVARGCAEEAVAVARAKGMDMKVSAVIERARALIRRIPDARTQMLIDHSAGKKAEVDAIHGAISSLGVALGVQTPTNRTVAALLKAHEAAS